MPPDPHRLAILTDLRKEAGLTLAEMARACGLHGQQSHQTAGAWEMGRMIPEEGRRRQAILHYLWDGLRLRTTPARVEGVWAVLVDEWGWQEITDREWQRLTSAPRPSRTAPLTDAPPTLAATTTRDAPFQAPPVVPHFVGRQHELHQIQHCLSDPATARPVALVGMGGVGKSTLATHLAHAARGNFPDGVLWVHMVQAEPLDILQSWAQLYGFDFRSLTDVENRAAAVRGMWGDKRVLLVLDDVRDLERLRPLLPGSATCGVLVTTRDRDLAALINARVVDLRELAADHSLALLSELLGGERVQRELDAARAIAHTIEHLPLALEIAARLLARSPWRTLSEMAARLADAARRLDRLAIKDVSVRTAFDVSWQSLPHDLRRLFALLGLFQARSFSGAAMAAAVDLPLDEAEEKLLELVNLSLLRVEGAQRFCQHPLLADFAREQMGEPGTALTRWADYYLAFAEQYRSQPAIVDMEMDNLMAVLETLHGRAEWLRVCQGVDALHPSWRANAHYAHARLGCRWALDSARNLADDHRLAQSLVWLGFACCEQNDYVEAEIHLQQAAQHARQSGESTLLAEALFYMARIAVERSDLESAEEMLNECQQLQRMLQDERGLARTASQYGLLFYRQGDYRLAADHCQRALLIQERLDDPPGLLTTLRLLTDAALAMRELEQAVAYAQRSLQLATQHGLLAELAEAHFSLATAGRMARNLPDARSHAEQALVHFRRIGNRSFLAYTEYELSVILWQQGDHAEALSAARHAIDLQRQIDDRYGLVTTLLHIGDLYLHADAANEASAAWREGARMAQEIRYAGILPKFAARIEKLGQP